MTLQRRWRAWLTDSLIDRWLSNGRYYQLNLVSGDHANPEYRIADDVRIATEAPVDFVSGITRRSCRPRRSSSCCGPSAARSTSPSAASQLHIPGFLVIAAVLYALLASGSMVLIGRRFVAGLREQEPGRGRVSLRAHAAARERREHRADPRRGGGARRRRPRRSGRCSRAWRDICRPEHEDDDGVADSGYIAPVLPIILCAPKFLDGSMSLGEVMQAASAFTIVQGAFNWLVDNYPRLADWTASARRVASLMVVARRAGARRAGRRRRPHRHQRRGRRRGACACRTCR